MNQFYFKNLMPVLLALVMWLSASVTVGAQARVQVPTVSIDVSDISVKEFLKELESQSGYTFAYVDSEIDLDRKVNVNATNQNVLTLVEQVLPNVTAVIRENKIILTRSKITPPNARKAEDVAQRTVTGRVLDQHGDPVVGAVVMLSGTRNGTATDLEGKYSINIRQNGAVLEFSSIGYKTTEVALNDYQVLADVVMPTEALMLDDVVVIGYGVQNKRDVTTAITSIKAEDFQQQSAADFRDAMAAKMPGVQVTTLGGQPDGNVVVRIRGIQSATAGNDPLYVIDGVPCDDRAFANLDGSDIESLEVLKDASAAAIYGSRGSCGVILITTKTGKSETPTISYDGQFSVSTVSKKIDMLDAYEWAEYYIESRNGAYLFNVPTGSIGDALSTRPEVYHTYHDIALAYLNDETGTLTNTDWQDEIFRTAISHKHSLSVSAKTKNYNYYVGANYLSQEGIIIGSDFQRVGMRMNLDGKKGRLKYGVRFSPSYSISNYVRAESQYNSDGVIAAALMALPIFPVYNKDGSYNWDMNGALRKTDTGGKDTQVNEVLNPVASALEIDDIRRKINLIGNAYASVEIIKGLEYRFTMGGDFYTYTRDYYRPSYLPNRGHKYIEYETDANGVGQYHAVLSDPDAKASSSQYFHWNISNQLSFNRKFGDHSISAVAAYEAEEYYTKTSVIDATGTAGDDKIKTTSGKTINIDNTYNNESASTFASWLVRAQYSYKGRYMVSASIRGDGSSRFAPNTRWGYFPAASVGWRISDENFMKGARWLDDLKLRASVGQTGNAQIGDSEYLSLYGTASVDLGNGLVNQVYARQIANDDLGWEKNTQYNVGLDFSLGNGIFGGNIDLYYTKTTDMLYEVPVSSASGFSTSNMNIGSMQNKGIELNFFSRKQVGKFFYELNANWSLNRNKVLSLGDEDAPLIVNSSYSGAQYITTVGQPVGCYYLLVQDGIFHNQEELDSYPHFEDTVVGDFRFLDADGDGVLEQDDDRVIVGNYMPDFYYGFGISLGWNGIDFNANFQGVYGNEILNLERRYLCNMEASSNMMTLALERFPYGELNRATRKSSGRNGSSTSTFHIEDGSYLRLQSLSIGYTFPKKWFSKAKISNLKIYLQGTNLFTLTNYTGYNPEVSNRTDAVSLGEDYCSYPLNRTFSVGLKFNL